MANRIYPSNRKEKLNLKTCSWQILACCFALVLAQAFSSKLTNIQGQHGSSLQLAASPGGSVNDHIDELNDLADESYDAESPEAKKATGKMAKKLRHKNYKVKIKAAKVLKDAPYPQTAITKLIESLKKEEIVLKKVLKIFNKNIVKLDRLMKPKSGGDPYKEYTKLIRTLNKFFEATTSLLDRANSSRDFSQEILQSLKGYRKERVYKAIRGNLARVKGWSAMETIPTLDILFSYELKLGLQDMIDFYNEDYDYSAMQSAIRQQKQKQSSNPKFADVTDEIKDWGKHIHVGFTALAMKKKLDGYPEDFNQFTASKWEKWFKLNKNHFKYSFKATEDSKEASPEGKKGDSKEGEKAE